MLHLNAFAFTGYKLDPGGLKKFYLACRDVRGELIDGLRFVVLMDEGRHDDSVYQNKKPQRVRLRFCVIDFGLSNGLRSAVLRSEAKCLGLTHSNHNRIRNGHKRLCCCIVCKLLCIIFCSKISPVSPFPVGSRTAVMRTSGPMYRNVVVRSCL